MPTTAKRALEASVAQAAPAMPPQLKVKMKMGGSKIILITAEMPLKIMGG